MAKASTAKKQPADNSSLVSVMNTDMSVVPSYVSTESGRGNENIAGNIAIPRLKQLQKMSNEVDKHHPDYIEGAEEGDWIDTIQRQVLGQSVKVISVNFKSSFVVWKNREASGNPQKLGEFETAEEANAAVAAQENQTFEKPNGETVPYWDVTKSHKHLVLAFDKNEQLLPTPYLMDFASSKITPSNNWNTKIHALQGDRFATVWEIKSQYMTKGTNAWFNIIAEGPVGWTAQNHYKVAEELYLSTKEF